MHYHHRPIVSASVRGAWSAPAGMEQSVGGPVGFESASVLTVASQFSTEQD